MAVIEEDVSASLKVTPHSIEAERSVLGGLMLSPDSWDDVAERVERVYERAHATEDSLVGRLARLSRCGAFAGPLFACVAAVDYVFWRWCEWKRPARTVEPAPDFIPNDGDFEWVDDE